MKNLDILENQNNEYLNLEMNIQRYSQSKYELELKYTIYCSNDSLYIFMNNLSIIFHLNDEIFESYSVIFTTPKQSYADVNYIEFNIETEIEVSGTINVTYNSTSISQDDNIAYSIKQRIMPNEIVFYQFHLPLIWIEVGYFISIVIIIISIISLSKRISTIPEQIKKRDERFYSYLKERQVELKQSELKERIEKMKEK